MLLIKIKQQDLLPDGKNISDSIAYFTRLYMICLCLSEFQLGTSPLGNPRESFLSERIPATRATFLSNSLPGAKNDGRIPGGGAKFPKVEETTP